VDRLISVTTRSISYLDKAAATQLLERPIESFPNIYPEGGVARILEQTHCHPYLLQKVGDELCRLLNEHEAVDRPASDAELTEVFDIVVAEVPLFDELWNKRSDRERATLRDLAEGQPHAPVPKSLLREGYVSQGETEGTQICVPLFARWIREYAEDSTGSST